MTEDVQRRVQQRTMLAEAGRAYITVWFALIFLTVMAVTMSAIEAVRISAIRLEAETASLLACEAYLSQYQIQVLDRYGLLMVETDAYDITFLEYFIGANCGEEDSEGMSWLQPEFLSVEITDEISIAEDDYRYLEDQITDLILVVKGSEAVNEIFEKLLNISDSDVAEDSEELAEQITQAGEDAQEQQEAYEVQIEAEQAAAEEAAEAAADGDSLGTETAGSSSEAYSGDGSDTTAVGTTADADTDGNKAGNADGDAEADGDTDEDTGGDTEGDTSTEVTASESQDVEDPRENLSQLLSYPITSLVMSGDVSMAVLDVDELSYVTEAEEDVAEVTGFFDYEDISDALSSISLNVSELLTGIGTQFLVDCYILEYFNTAQNQDQADGACALSYEVEYILYGQEGDAQNLANTIQMISLIRTVMNVRYLLSDTEKSNLAKEAATGIASAVGMPFLSQILYLLILAAWGYAEALVDCRILLSGGKVPFTKTDETWKLSLEQLVKISINDLNKSGSSEEEDGLTYENYMQILLLTVGKEKKYTRMLNLIEANTRLDAESSDFCLSDCVFGITITADFSISSWFLGTDFGKDSYEHHVTRSISY